jgi:signal transduction histidine kinase
MRRLLGVLRRAGDGAALAPQPGLSEVGRLVGQVGRDGFEVELRFDPDCVALGPGPDLAAYRVVQHALETAAAGGASRASVRIDCTDDELRLEVRDDRRTGDSDPAALTASRERLGLYGGRLRSGRDGEHFAVEARLPLEAVMR